VEDVHKDDVPIKQLIFKNMCTILEAKAMKYWILLVIVLSLYSSTRGFGSFSGQTFFMTLIGNSIVFILPVWIVVSIVRWLKPKKKITNEPL
jgi:hypothetical protein